MTPERFGDLLRKPALLSGHSAIELEELIAAYPWCGPLRRLRYYKALLDDHAGDIDIWRSRAEPFINHASMRENEQWLRHADPVRASQHFGFLDSVEEDSEADTKAHDTALELQPSISQLVENASAASLASVTSSLEAEIELAHPETMDAQENQDEAEPAWRLDEDLLGMATAAVGTVEWYLHRYGLIMEYGKPHPVAKESLRSFREWKQLRAQTSWRDLLMLGSEQHSRSQSRKTASESGPQPELATETLAELLASQGHTEKAIRMFEQLSLRYPEKSGNFAARIQALQQHV